MVRREFCYLSTWITISRANKVRPRITRTLKVIGSSQIPSIGLLVTFLRAEICSLLLISACLPISSWEDGCQELAAKRCSTLLTGRWTWCTYIPFSHWYYPSSFPIQNMPILLLLLLQLHFLLCHVLSIYSIGFSISYSLYLHTQLFPPYYHSVLLSMLLIYDLSFLYKFHLPLPPITVLNDCYPL